MKIPKPVLTLFVSRKKNALNKDIAAPTNIQVKINNPILINRVGE